MNSKSWELSALASQFGSPVYLYDIDAIIERYQEISSSFKQRYPETSVALSYKTCPLMGVLQTLHQQGAKAEVVSEFESDMADRLSHNGKIINGPFKSDRMLSQAIMNDDIINIDHHDEFLRLDRLAKRAGKMVEIGVRLSLGKHWNRFGFPASDTLWNSLMEIQTRLSSLKITGIHVHIGTAIRSTAVFYQAAETLAEKLASWPFTWPIKWLDIGGGLAGISPKWEDQELTFPVPAIDGYRDAWLDPLSDVLEQHRPRLLLEPGRTLFEPFGSLLTRVITCRSRDNDTQSVVVDGGINAVPTARVYRHPVYTKISGNLKTDVYGPLCLQADTLVRGGQLPELNTGDCLLVQGIGAYNQSRSVPFIQPRPGVIGYHQGEWRWLRRPENLENHLSLEVW